MRSMAAPQREEKESEKMMSAKKAIKKLKADSDYREQVEGWLWHYTSTKLESWGHIGGRIVLDCKNRGVSPKACASSIQHAYHMQKEQRSGWRQRALGNPGAHFPPVDNDHETSPLNDV